MGSILRVYPHCRSFSLGTLARNFDWIVSPTRQLGTLSTTTLVITHPAQSNSQRWLINMRDDRCIMKSIVFVRFLEVCGRVPPGSPTVKRGNHWVSQRMPLVLTETLPQGSRKSLSGGSFTWISYRLTDFSSSVASLSQPLTWSTILSGFYPRCCPFRQITVIH